MVQGVGLDVFIPSLSRFQTGGGELALRSHATRLRVLTDIAVALRYLHSRLPCAVVHGDLRTRSSTGADVPALFE